MLPVAIGVGAVLALSYVSGPRNTTPMTGPDGETYEIQNLPNKEEAVKRMAGICAKLTKLREHYGSEPGLAADPPVARFLARFQPDCFVENDMSSRDTSYSENKGQKIVVCLRDKTKAPAYPLIEENTVMFVMLHEMAHLMTETIGHTQEFWTNFKRILHDAVKLGIYSPVNYAQTPTPYCGMMITDNPI
uniref:WLM domain-containing protein n=1 Tax=viral metagenome TaxID=1070528 RepID=A0A6C0F1V9_9ZZZZ